MRRNIGAQDIANEICMKRMVAKDVFVIVEGNTDIRLYGKFVRRDVSMIPGHSKSNVLSAMNELSNRGMNEAMGIVDGDFDRILDIEREIVDVFHTDTHDLETMIIRSRALDAVLQEYAKEEDVRRLELARGKGIRQLLLEAAMPLGALVLISVRGGLGLRFKGCHFEKFIDRSLHNDLDSMISDVLHNSNFHVTIDQKELRTRLERELKMGHDPWQLVRGHDMVSILLIGLLRSFGDYNARDLDKGALGGALRLAYSYQMFSRTELHHSMTGWELRHGREVLGSINDASGSLPSRDIADPDSV